MKLKYPAKVRIGSKEFKVKYSKGHDGGAISYEKGLIEIGTRGDNVTTLDVIIHELKEAIQIEQSVRFDSPHTDGEFHFFYDHGHHTDLCSRLAGLLDLFIK